MKEKSFKDETQENDFFQQIRMNQFSKQFNIIDSPQIVNALCELSKDKRIEKGNDKDKKGDLWQISQLIDNNQSVKKSKINKYRKTFREIRQKTIKALEKLQKSQQQLEISEIFTWKQEILSKYMGEFTDLIKDQCKQKASTLLFIWNTAFSMTQFLLKRIVKISKQQEKTHLNQVIGNHESYQNTIEQMKIKIEKKQTQIEKQNQFINSLVYNLRYKRKQILKFTKNLKLCTNKLNECKDLYLDLQDEHIDLLADSRDIDKQNAEYLLKRKLEIKQEMRKQIKIKNTKKKVVNFEIEKQLKYQDTCEPQAVSKLQKQIKQNFLKTYQEQKNVPKYLKTASCHIFEDALDDFNIKVNRQYDNENFIDYRSNAKFADQQTDMTGFIKEVQEVDTQITFIDKLYENMIINRGCQTSQIKVKSKTYTQIGIQLNLVEINHLNFKICKTIDRSYLLRDYREKKNVILGQQKNLISEKIPTKGKINQLERSSKKQTIEKQRGIQTVQSLVINFDSSNLTQKIRFKIEQNFSSFINQNIAKIKSDIQEQFLEDNVKSSRKNSRSSLSNRLSRTSRKKFKSNYSLLSDQSTKSSSFISDRKKNINNSKNNTRNSSLYQIKQDNFENLQSKKRGRGIDFVEQSKNQAKKFYQTGKEANLSTHKKILLNNLNRGDKIFNSDLQKYKTSQNSINNFTKIIMQFENNKQNFEQIQEHIFDNISMIRQQLEKTMVKKRLIRKMPISRQNNLYKIISLVYTYGFHILLNKKKNLISLITPLFHYFKIGYGELKKNDLYLRMLYFLSQIYLHKDQNYIFYNFITFLGLNITNQEDENILIGRNSTELYFKLIEKLSVNFKLPIQIEKLYTNKQLIEKELPELLKQFKFSDQVINKITLNLNKGLDKLLNKSEINARDQQKQEVGCQQNVKVHLFQIILKIFELTTQIKKQIKNSYEKIEEYFQEQTQTGEKSHLKLVQFIISCLFQKREIRIKKQKEMIEEYNMIKQDQVDSQIKAKGIQIQTIFLRLNIPNFTKLYFKALSKFKIKEDFLYLSIKRRFQFLVNFIKGEQSFAIENKILDFITKKTEKTFNNQVYDKKLLSLTYLKIIQYKSSKVLSEMIGPNLMSLYQL